MNHKSWLKLFLFLLGHMTCICIGLLFIFFIVLVIMFKDMNPKLQIQVFL